VLVSKSKLDGISSPCEYVTQAGCKETSRGNLSAANYHKIVMAPKEEIDIDAIPLIKYSTITPIA